MDDENTEKKKKELLTIPFITQWWQVVVIVATLLCAGYMYGRDKQEDKDRIVLQNETVKHIEEIYNIRNEYSVILSEKEQKIRDLQVELIRAEGKK